MSDIGSLKIALSASTEGLKKGMQEAVSVVETNGKKMGEAAKSASTQIETGMKAAGTGTESLRTQLRKATQDAQRMAEQFGMNSKEFRAAAQTAGELKDQMGDVNAVIGLLAQDVPALAMLGHSMKIAGSVTQVAAGAMGLLGDNSKETQEMLLKVQSAMAFGQGIAQLGELKDSFGALTNIIKLNPLAAGMVAAAVVAATAAFIAYNASITDTERATAALNEAQAQGLSKSQEELTHLNVLVAIAKDVSQSTQVRQKAIDELNQKYPQYLKNITLENINSREAAKGIDAATEAIKRRAQATAIEQKLVELNKKLIERKGDIGKTGSLMDQAMGFFSPAGAHGVIVNDIKSITAQIDILSKELTKYSSEVVTASNAVEKQHTAETKTTTALHKKAEAVKKVTQAQQEQREKEELLSVNTQKTPQRPTGGDLITPSFTPQSKPEVPDEGLMTKKQIEHQKELYRLTELQAQRYQDLAANTNTAFQSALGSMIGGWAELTGAALAGASVSFEQFGAVALQAVAGFMKQLGEQFIAIGTSRIAVDAFVPVPGAGPAIVAAGTALLVAASFAQTRASSSPMNGASGAGGFDRGGTNQQSGGTIRLASGGMAFGESLAVVGDNRAARFDPEVIAPLSKLKQYMNTGSSDINVHGSLHGETILLSGVRSKQKMGRKGMRF